MASLYKRASTSQRQILRIVEGSVINAMHAHPDYPYSERMARSIAKRAAGTLSAQLAGMLAAESLNGSPSERPVATLVHRRGQRGAKVVKRNAQGRGCLSLRRHPRSSKFLVSSLGAMAKVARMMGQKEREETCIEILRLIAELKRG